MSSRGEEWSSEVVLRENGVERCLVLGMVREKMLENKKQRQSLGDHLDLIHSGLHPPPARDSLGPPLRHAGVLVHWRRVR